MKKKLCKHSLLDFCLMKTKKKTVSHLVSFIFFGIVSSKSHEKTSIVIICSLFASWMHGIFGYPFSGFNYFFTHTRTQTHTWALRKEKKTHKKTVLFIRRLIQPQLNLFGQSFLLKHHTFTALYTNNFFLSRPTFFFLAKVIKNIRSPFLLFIHFLFISICFKRISCLFSFWFGWHFVCPMCLLLLHFRSLRFVSSTVINVLLLFFFFFSGWNYFLCLFEFQNSRNDTELSANFFRVIFFNLNNVNKSLTPIFFECKM